MEYHDAKKRVRVVDMMVTMHSILAERYRRRAVSLDISILIISITLVALSFANIENQENIIIREGLYRWIIRGSSVGVFIASMISLYVDWKGRAAQHQNAFKRLVDIKGQWRDCVNRSVGFNEELAEELDRRTALVLQGLISIPDSQFSALKARHLRKVEVSKAIGRIPGAPIWLIKSRLVVDGIKQVFRQRFREE